MTTRDLVNSPAVKLLAWGAAFGIAYGRLQSQVNRIDDSKADKVEMAELRALVAQQAKDIRVLRLIGCRTAKMDSFCETQP